MLLSFLTGQVLQCLLFSVYYWIFPQENLLSASYLKEGQISKIMPHQSCRLLLLTNLPAFLFQTQTCKFQFHVTTAPASIQRELSNNININHAHNFTSGCQQVDVTNTLWPTGLTTETANAKLDEWSLVYPYKCIVLQLHCCFVPSRIVDMPCFQPEKPVNGYVAICTTSLSL